MKWIRALASSLLGAAYYRALLAVGHATQIPRFVPSWDDSDSNLRAAVLVLVGFPWFMALGAVLGRSPNWHAYAVRWAGVVAGSAACLAMTAALSPALATLDKRTLANAAAVTLIVCMPLASTLGAWLAGRRRSAISA
ncbi:MAG: hypothetical protein JWN48_5951 [Myxococcaceae bacterium]|nr:hypothetical protein [Myxococcaceae bacterium]